MVSDDALLTYTSKVDALVDRIDALLDAQMKGGNEITVTHTQSGMSAWGAAAITACFCTWFGLILVMLDMHDMRAWMDILKQRITLLESKK